MLLRLLKKEQQQERANGDTESNRILLGVRKTENRAAAKNREQNDKKSPDRTQQAGKSRREFLQQFVHQIPLPCLLPLPGS